MKNKNLWFVAGLLAVLAMVLLFLSAIVTVTGAFNLDPKGKANNMDFVWAAIFYAIAMSCFWRAHQLNKK